MIKIYIGDVTDNLRLTAQKESVDAKLLTSENCQDLVPGVYYLSIGDLSGIEEFVKTLYQADELVYAPPTQWSDIKDSYSFMQYWTEFYVNFFKDKKKVTCLVEFPDISKHMLGLADVRKTNDPQIWIAGCSISHGTGVKNNQRYGELIANDLNMPVSFLTCSGSSISWSADQILRSDIRTGDIVIWGITGIDRFTYYHDDKIQHISHGYYSNNPQFNKIVSLDSLTSPHRTYQAVTSIYQVVNFCAKLNVRLYLAGLLVSDRHLSYLMSLPNYTQFFGYPSIELKSVFIDVGTDREHPGPLTHQ